jgi:hypothetical protein
MLRALTLLPRWRPTRKAVVYGLGVAVLLSSTIFLIMGLTSRQPEEASNAVETKQEISLPFRTPALINLPVHPDARLIDRNTSEAPEHELAIYETTAGYEELARFYRERLQAAGWHNDTPRNLWVFVNGERVDPDQLGNETLASLPEEIQPNFFFSWSDPTGTVPYQLSLYVAFLEVGNKKHIQTVLSYIPDVDRIPNYPGATDLEVKSGFDEVMGGPVPAQITSYIAPASQAEVEAYMRAILPLYGWHWAELGPHAIEFGWSNRSVHEHRGVTVSLHTEPIDATSTKVEVRVRGASLN